MPAKKKGTSDFLLADAINAASSSQAPPARPEARTDKGHQLHPNAVRSMGVLEPKRFVYKKKKVKGLSSLKKKILLVSCAACRA